MGLGIVKSIFSYPQTCLTSNDLETFYNTSYHLAPKQGAPLTWHTLVISYYTARSIAIEDLLDVQVHYTLLLYSRGLL